MSRASTQQMLHKLPASWAIGILILLVAYWFAQPVLNSQLGLSLPSLAGLLGEPQPKAKTAAPPKASVTERSKQADDQDPDNNSGTDQSEASSLEQSPAEESSTATKSVPRAPSAETAKPSSDLLYGVLKDNGRQRYVSPEGLQYNPGSEEGHRLKHLERHLKDQPNRPGKHGVFDGDMSQALKWIDDAYARGKRGAKGVRKQEEDGRTVYEVPFASPIGYIGGKDGKRDGNPSSKRLRLVVDGSRFVTAFPF